MTASSATPSSPVAYQEIRRFFIRLILLFLLLALALPWLRDAYAAAFRTLVSALLNFARPPWQIELSPGGTDLHLTIINQTLMNQDGSGPVRNLAIAMEGFWHDAALLIALFLATPRSWFRRVRDIAFGLLTLEIFALAALLFALWNESRFVQLAHISPALAPFTDKLEEMLLSQLTLFLPVLCWLLSFRANDLLRLARGPNAG